MFPLGVVNCTTPGMRFGGTSGESLPVWKVPASTWVADATSARACAEVEGGAVLGDEESAVAGAADDTGEVPGLLEVRD